MEKIRFFEWLPDVDHGGLQLPHRQTENAAGYDLFAFQETIIHPDEIILAPTGVRIKLPPGEFLAIFARSSLAIRHRLMLANGVGVIDADYYGNPGNGGEILVPLWNAGREAVILQRGERIAQGIVLNYFPVDGEMTGQEVQRTGGFGSTGAF